MIKPWISFSSHVVAATTSFLVCTGGALLLGAFAWTQNALPPALCDVLALPLACLGWGLGATVLGALGSGAALRLSQRAGWNSLMAPALLGCAATVGVALLNSTCSLHLSSAGVLGLGAAVGASFGSYFLPLSWARRVLPRLDGSVGRWRQERELPHLNKRVSLS